MQNINNDLFACCTYELPRGSYSVTEYTDADTKVFSKLNETLLLKCKLELGKIK